jgi:threonyl-tRNA synthetase
MADAIEPKEDFKSLPKEERLNRMRHSAAHVLAEAMVELMPDAELGIGPAHRYGLLLRLPAAPVAYARGPRVA